MSKGARSRMIVMRTGIRTYGPQRVASRNIRQFTRPTHHRLPALIVRAVTAPVQSSLPLRTKRRRSPSTRAPYTSRLEGKWWISTPGLSRADGEREGAGAIGARAMITLLQTTQMFSHCRRLPCSSLGVYTAVVWQVRSCCVPVYLVLCFWAEISTYFQQWRDLFFPAALGARRQRAFFCSSCAYYVASFNGTIEDRHFPVQASRSYLKGHQGCCVCVCVNGIAKLNCVFIFRAVYVREREWLAKIAAQRRELV